MQDGFPMSSIAMFVIITIINIIIGYINLCNILNSPVRKQTVIVERPRIWPQISGFVLLRCHEVYDPGCLFWP